MGGEGADDATLAVLDELLARRRGTAPGRQARDADELAVLVDRAGDLTRDELAARVAPSDGVAARRSARRRCWRAAGWSRPSCRAGAASRALHPGRRVRRAMPRHSATSARDRLRRHALEPRRRATSCRSRCAHAALTERAARREVLARFLALAGPVSVDEIRARYAFEPRWVAAPARGVAAEAACSCAASFGGDRDDDALVLAPPARAGAPRASSRRRASRSRRCRSPTFARFMQRWQHLDAGRRGSAGTTARRRRCRQLYGLARPADGVGARLPAGARRAATTPARSRALAASRARSCGPRAARATSVGVAPLARAWGASASSSAAPAASGSRAADRRVAARRQRARGARRARARRARRSPPTSQRRRGSARSALRDALRELVAAGLVTNDTVDALRDVIRWRPLLPASSAPTSPTPRAGSRRTSRRRRTGRSSSVASNPRRLAKWKRPDREERRELGRPLVARAHARHRSAPRPTSRRSPSASRGSGSARYGIVSRDWWRRERPAVGWREIYHELKRLEFRGEVRRGYFVAGLAGAQFALPEAVELLRAPVPDDDATEIVVMSASDPANVYALPLAPGTAADPLARPRGAGALLVTRAGRIVLAAEGRGGRLRVARGRRRGRRAPRRRARWPSGSPSAAGRGAAAGRHRRDDRRRARGRLALCAGVARGRVQGDGDGSALVRGTALACARSARRAPRVWPRSAAPASRPRRRSADATSVPSFADVSASADSPNASDAMNSDIVKPMPPSRRRRRARASRSPPAATRRRSARPATRRA